MITALVAVLACTIVFAIVGPVIARRVAPAWATRMLVPASLLMIAAATIFALSAAAFTLIGQFPEIAELGPWSPTRSARTPRSRPVPLSAGGLLLAYAADPRWSWSRGDRWR